MSPKDGPDLQAQYCVKLVCEISDDHHGGKDHACEPFSRTVQTYHKLSYKEILIIQKAVADALLGLGYAALEKAG